MFPELTRDDVFRLETRRLWLRWPRMADANAILRLACFFFFFVFTAMRRGRAGGQTSASAR